MKNSRRRRCSRKQDKKNIAAIRRSFQGGKKKKDAEGQRRSTMLAKRKSCFTITSLLKDATIQLRKLNDLQNAKHWILRLNANGHQKSLRQRPEFAAASWTDTSTTSQNGMAVLQRATVKLGGSIFIFNIAVANFTVAKELELMAAYIIREMVVISVSGKFQKIDGWCRQDTHSQHASVQDSLFTSAERIARAWLKNCMTSLCA